MIDTLFLVAILQIVTTTSILIGAGGLSLLMIAAFLNHLNVKNPIYKTLPALALLSISIIILFSSYM